MRNSAFLISCLLFGLIVVGPQAQQGRGGSSGGGTKHPNGTLNPKPLDPGRPWGWATKAFMSDPNRVLYNTAKAKLLSGKQIYGHSITRFDPKAYCEQAPHYDYTWFEMQHSTLWYADIERMVAACPRVGATPMLRVPDANEGTIQHAVDMGMLGIIVPSVDDAAEALQAAKFARFPPAGRRNVANSSPSVGLWTPVVPPGQTFRQSMNDNMLVILMIESLEGVNNALEIASQPGVDVVIQGNSDLASFSGWPASDDRYQDLLTRIRDAVYLAGKYWGNAAFTYGTGNRLSPDSRWHQNGPSNDGWVRPAGGAPEAENNATPSRTPQAPAAQAANDPAEERAVLAAMDAMVQATVKKDVAALNRIYSDDLMYSHTSGLTQTKAEVISTLVSSPRIVEGMKFEKTTVQIHGPVALVKNVTHLRNGEPNNIRQSDLHILWVLVKGPQGWQVTARHPSRLPAAKPTPSA